MDNKIFTVEKVSKSFSIKGDQPLKVLDNIDFTLHEGEIVALLGKSGSGKSTLLRIIAGLMNPTTGEVLYRGKRYQHQFLISQWSFKVLH